MKTAGADSRVRSSPSDVSPVIRLCQVEKRYRRNIALYAMTFAVAPGELVGFLGPNGAGKTTTLRLMGGFLRPSAGRVELFGHDMSDARSSRIARCQLGYVPDIAGVDSSLTGRQLLNELSTLQGAQPVDRERIVAALDLRTADLERPMERLSRGTRQKINLIQGMQHRPPLLILDEPTEALDPLAKRALFQLLREANRQGTTIFFSSHTLSEVEELCHRVILIRDGHLIADDQVDALRAGLGRRVSIQITEAASSDLDAVVRHLEQTAGVELVEVAGMTIVLHADPIKPLLLALVELPVHDLWIEPPSLERVFLRYYQSDDICDGRSQ